MTYVNPSGYFERRTAAGKNTHSLPTTRQWWLVKANKRIGLGSLVLNEKYVGKKVMFKVELMQDRVKIDDRRNKN